MSPFERAIEAMYRTFAAKAVFEMELRRELGEYDLMTEHERSLHTAAANAAMLAYKNWVNWEMDSDDEVRSLDALRCEIEYAIERALGKEV